MEISEKYGFYLPSRDTDDIADINQISENFRIIDENIPSKEDLENLGSNVDNKQDKFADVTEQDGVVTVKSTVSTDRPPIFVFKNGVLELGAMHLQFGDGMGEVSLNGLNTPDDSLNINANDNRIRNVADPKFDKDAVNKKYLDKKIDQTFNPESTNAQSGIAVAEAQNFKHLFDTVTVTQEAFDEAGEEGINVISIGDENIDLSLYDEILISLKVPNSSGINTSNGLLRCFLGLVENYVNADTDWFVFTQSEGLSTNCVIRPDWNNIFTIKGIWKEDMFLYGEVIRNGWSNACGYTGAITGWNNLHEGFKKSSKKYIHITTNNNFKFPVGTTINVYGR